MFYQFTFCFMFRHISYWKSLLKIIIFIKIIYKKLIICRKYCEFYFKSTQYLFQYFIKGNNLSITYTSTAFFQGIFLEISASNSVNQFYAKNRVIYASNITAIWYRWSRCMRVLGGGGADPSRFSKKYLSPPCLRLDQSCWWDIGDEPPSLPENFLDPHMYTPSHRRLTFGLIFFFFLMHNHPFSDLRYPSMPVNLHNNIKDAPGPFYQ